MSYIVNVHYKSDPKNLYWQYSGRSHTCLQNAVDELISAQNQPHIDKAIVAGSGKGLPVDNKDLLNRAVEDVIKASERLVTLCEDLYEMPLIIAYASNIYASAHDMVENRGVKKEDLLSELERVISHLKEDFHEI